MHLRKQKLSIKKKEIVGSYWQGMGRNNFCNVFFLTPLHSEQPAEAFCHSLGLFCIQQIDDTYIFLIFPRKQALRFHANCLLFSRKLA